jgi:hypothetical protein
MEDGRRSPRYQTTARVQIPGVLETECSLVNISVTGCCVECPNTAAFQANEHYQLELMPESASHIGNFQLQADCKWVRGSVSSTEVGFSIVASPKGKQFQHYVDYLAYRHSVSD